MKPRYTDRHKYPHGYTRASETDIRKTFARARTAATIPANVKQLRKANA
jgi:hypothetical protein